MTLVLYLGLLALLALLTAYTRNYQRTVVDLDQSLDAGGRLIPPMQPIRTMLVAGLWPLALLIGLAFIAWWKAVVLVVGSFVLLTPVLGSFTPRPMSRHFLNRVEDHLRRRIAEHPAERADLERLARQLERKISSSA
jgi:ABC-type transport system involved in cytochrome bd biosynthesis fused ATPase/permease subunit